MKWNYKMNWSYNSITEICVTFVIQTVYNSKNRDRTATSHSETIEMNMQYF